MYLRKAQALAAELALRFGREDVRFAFEDLSKLSADSGGKLLIGMDQSCVFLRVIQPVYVTKLIPDPSLLQVLSGILKRREEMGCDLGNSNSHLQDKAKLTADLGMLGAKTRGAGSQAP